MINKDYILRIAESFGRELSIILGLRQRNQHEEALIYIDNLFFNNLGLTSSFINSVSEDVLLKTLSPLGNLNVEKCLLVAALLKMEGDIYEEMGKSDESYYHYLKSLNLLLAVQLDERTLSQSYFYTDTEDLLHLLTDYELPTSTKSKLITYYELTGNYARAEDMLYEVRDASDVPANIRQQGRAFYARLEHKSDADLLAGNLSREEIAEGIAEFGE